MKKQHGTSVRQTQFIVARHFKCDIEGDYEHV